MLHYQFWGPGISSWLLQKQRTQLSALDIPEYCSVLNVTGCGPQDRHCVHHLSSPPAHQYTKKDFTQTEKTNHFPGTAQRQNWKPVTLYHWFSLLRVAAHFITRKQKQASRIPKWFNLVLLLLFAQRAAHVGVDKCCQLPQKVAPPSDLNHNQIHFSKTVTK